MNYPESYFWLLILNTRNGVRQKCTKIRSRGSILQSFFWVESNKFPSWKFEQIEVIITHLTLTKLGFICKFENGIIKSTPGLTGWCGFAGFGTRVLRHDRPRGHPASDLTRERGTSIDMYIHWILCRNVSNDAMLRDILNFTPGPQGWNLSSRGNVHPFVHPPGRGEQWILPPGG
jgi:hypothetical protein